MAANKEIPINELRNVIKDYLDENFDYNGYVWNVQNENILKE